MNILLVGYYGHGNFGDDVLFRASLGLVSGLWPQARIAVQTEARDPSYLSALAGCDLQFVQIHDGGTFDLAFHGGGGNFFDFTGGRALDLAVNRVAAMLGPDRFAAVMGGLRKRLDRNPISVGRRAAIGLGIGTYTPNARRLRHELPVLAAMEFLGVRDPGSIENLRAIGITEHVVETSDLAFAGGWGESGAAAKGMGPVVVVVRDWLSPADNRRQLDALHAVAAIRPVRVILFDEAADRGLLPLLGKFPVQIYSPGDMNAVIETLSSAPAIVTSRAHGAICGAILGVPSLLLPIEPKLAAVNRMLPRSTILPDWSDNVARGLSEVLLIDRRAIADDGENNKLRLDRSLQEFRQVMTDGNG